MPVIFHQPLHKPKMDQLQRFSLISKTDQQLLLRLHPATCLGLPEDKIRMEQLLQDEPGLLDRPIVYPNGVKRLVGTLALHAACQCLHANCVTFLLDQGVKINQDSIDGKCALYFSIIDHDNFENRKDCLKVVKILLTKKGIGTKIYTHEYNLYFDVIVMIHNQLNDIIKLLLEYDEVGANVKEFSYDMLERNSPIIAAFEAKNIDALKLLIMHGARVLNYMRYGHGRYAIACHIVQFYQSTSDMIRVLRIFRSFGGNLWEKHTRFPGDQLLEKNQTALDLLREKSLDDKTAEIELEEIMCNPCSLQELSRLVIWRKLNIKYWTLINELDVPLDVKLFLKLCDL